MLKHAILNCDPTWHALPIQYAADEIRKLIFDVIFYLKFNNVEIPNLNGL
jgi:hypothetical protein